VNVSTNDQTDEFDRHIDHLGRAANTPPCLVDAAVYVRDTLAVAWLTVPSVFKERATPELALAVYKHIDGQRFERLEEAREEAKRQA
jgi:hypothetical protein